LESMQPSAYVKAPLGRRYLALLVDMFIAVGPALSGVALMALALSLPGVSGHAAIGMATMILMLAAYLVMGLGLIWFFVYYFLKDAWQKGCSIGKRLFGLMVIGTSSNTPCTRWQSVFRNIGYLLPLTQMLDPFAVLQDAQGRRVGDYLAGTQVIAAADYLQAGRHSDGQPVSAIHR
jgi:uncharacterized RDD family membrane protein YckC